MAAISIIARNINIDFVKYGVRRETAVYVNNLLVNNFVPMRIMPSRNTATITDRIYYYESCNSKKDLSILTGNLWSDLADH